MMNFLTFEKNRFPHRRLNRWVSIRYYNITHVYLITSSKTTKNFKTNIWISNSIEFKSIKITRIIKEIVITVNLLENLINFEVFNDQLKPALEIVQCCVSQQTETNKGKWLLSCALWKYLHWRFLLCFLEIVQCITELSLKNRNVRRNGLEATLLKQTLRYLETSSKNILRFSKWVKEYQT